MISFSLQKNLHTAEGYMQLDISCELKNGELMSLYGPSGAGKTSVLRMLAGLMVPDSGIIKIDNDIWYNSKEHIHLAPQKRKIGFVFQDYALFPNMNVEENLAFALSKGEPRDIIEELLELTGLSLLRKRKIQALSGGQQQRVALARAIAKKPKLLLLDEPLSAIDDKLRGLLQETLLQVHQLYGLTTILVSHDIREIIRLADSLLLLEKGQAHFHDTPYNYFMEHTQDSAALTGDVLFVGKEGQKNYILLFTNNKVLKIMAQDMGSQEIKKGEHIRVIYQDSLPLITKI